MFFLFILLLPFTLGTPRPYERYLDAPKLISVSGTEPAGLFVTWRRVFYEASDPVKGLKIKLWTVEQETELRYELINADEYPGYVHDLRPSKAFMVNETLTTPSRDIIVNDSAQINVHIENLEYNIIYEVRVLAFKIDHEGPMSDPMRIKMIKGKRNHGRVIQKLPTGCSFLFKSQMEVDGENYPHEHISYL